MYEQYEDTCSPLGHICHKMMTVAVQCGNNNYNLQTDK
jgi:hypothetical protein